MGWCVFARNILDGKGCCRLCAPLGACWKVPKLKPFPVQRPCCAVGWEDVAKTAGKSVHFPTGRGGGAAVLRHISV